MDILSFNDIEEFACAVSDEFSELNVNECEDIDIIGKYAEISEILKHLICIGHGIKTLSIDCDNIAYDDEYILSIDHEGDIWVEPFMHNREYINTEATIIYIFDNCNSEVIKHCNGDTLYEVNIADDDMYNTELNDNSEYIANDDNGKYIVNVTCNIDFNNTVKVIKEMERCLTHMDEMFDEINNFKRLFGW